MTQVKTPTELDPATIRLQDRVRELEHDQAAGQEVLRAQQAEIAKGEATIENLNVALLSSRKIGTAMGILMASIKVTSDEAFELLRLASQKENRKLRLVADDVVLTGTLL